MNHAIDKGEAKGSLRGHPYTAILAFESRSYVGFPPLSDFTLSSAARGQADLDLDALRQAFDSQVLKVSARDIEAFINETQKFARALDVAAKGADLRSLDVLLATSWVRLADIKHILPPRKLRSRAEKGARLTTEESEKVLRIARVAEAATDFFGDKGKADKWMRSPKRFLDGKAPADIMHMESGAWLIENHLLQSEHGFAA